MSKPFWEEGYSDPDAMTFGGPSDEVRDIALRLPVGASVLDVGCGEGRNAIFLSERGFEVTAIDISDAGIRKLRALAEKKGLNVRASVCDMRDYPFRGRFDVIMSHGCLHLAEREAWEKMIPRFKAQTNPGGFNIIVVFTDAIPPPEDLKDICLGLFRDGELFDLYADWEILVQQSYVKEDQHPGSLRHRHPVNKLVARKQ
jgi:tellurite methyltransferase